MNKQEEQQNTIEELIETKNTRSWKEYLQEKAEIGCKYIFDRITYMLGLGPKPKRKEYKNTSIVTRVEEEKIAETKTPEIPPIPAKNTVSTQEKETQEEEGSLSFPVEEDFDEEEVEYYYLDDDNEEVKEEKEEDSSVTKKERKKSKEVEEEDNEENEEEDEEEEEDGEEEESFKGPALEVFGTDLTKKAREGKIEECFGREAELLEMMEILVRRQKNNPVLVGDAGVGKTAIVELFANRIVNNLVPFILDGRRLVSVDLAKMIAGARYRGEFELRLQKLLDEVINEPEVIVFIDEIHNIGGAGSAEGSMDAANILKPILSRSGFQCIGATTGKEYEKIEKDAALNRRFQPIRVNEPSVDDTIKILNSLKPSLEGFHNVQILPSAVHSAAELSDRYIYDRFLPDKAIDLVDRAAAKEVIKATSVYYGSVVSAIVNSSLNKVANLKLEAFRRGDIASEFILQEVENAYRNFLLRWVESPEEVLEKDENYPDFPDSGDNEKPKRIASPISQALFDKMQLSVLTYVDELLFASSKTRQKIQLKTRYQDLSSEKNDAILSKLLKKLENSKSSFSKISIYRISLLLLNLTSNIKSSKENKAEIKSNFGKLIKAKHCYKHIWEFIESNQSYEDNFCPVDYEEYEESIEIISQLEEARIKTLKNFIKELKPVLRKGIVESLRSSAEIKLSDTELAAVYSLLGYFSTDRGRDFLGNLDAPELLQMARKNGDFTGLKKQITDAEIRNLISKITGIPLQSLSSQESEKLANLETILHQRVIGQEEAVSAIAKAIRRSRLGIQNPNRPVASFFFCGPTGVGKTEVTKALAQHMFGSEQDMIRFDMSEFMEKFSVSRLIGSPPGYVGYEEGGQLTDAVRKKPYSVVLFDEIEKAHPDVLNILLQILEDGRLTDSQKRLVLFDNTVIIMTSNAGAEEIQQIIKKQRQAEAINVQPTQEKSEKSTEIVYHDKYAGAIKFLEAPIYESYLSDLHGKMSFEFQKSFRDYNAYKNAERKARGLNDPEIQQQNQEENVNYLKSAVLERLTTMFLPEFLNRLDDIIIFQPLKPEELRKICEIMIKQVEKRVSKKSIQLEVEERVKNKLTTEGYNPAFGARPLRRLIIKYIEDSISDIVLKSKSLRFEKKISIFLNDSDEIVAKEIFV